MYVFKEPLVERAGYVACRWHSIFLASCLVTNGFTFTLVPGTACVQYTKTKDDGSSNRKKLCGRICLWCQNMFLWADQWCRLPCVDWNWFPWSLNHMLLVFLFCPNMTDEWMSNCNATEMRHVQGIFYDNGLMFWYILIIIIFFVVASKVIVFA